VNGFVLLAWKQQLVLRKVAPIRLRCTLINSVHFAVRNFVCAYAAAGVARLVSHLALYKCATVNQREYNMHLPGNFITQ
jgi:hypothetical protein